MPGSVVGNRTERAAASTNLAAITYSLDPVGDRFVAVQWSVGSQQLAVEAELAPRPRSRPPLDDRLDAVDPAGLAAADTAREWQAYVSLWTSWNHVRTVAPLAGSVLFASRAALLLTGRHLVAAEGDGDDDRGDEGERCRDGGGGRDPGIERQPGRLQ